MSYVPRLKSEYKERVVKALTEEFSYKNVMQVPKLEKIVLSKGVGAAIADKKLIDYALEELTKITGQKAVSTMSKKDVASFKLRKGMPCRILRGSWCNARRGTIFHNRCCDASVLGERPWDFDA